MAVKLAVPTLSLVPSVTFGLTLFVFACGAVYMGLLTNDERDAVRRFLRWIRGKVLRSPAT